VPTDQKIGEKAVEITREGKTDVTNQSEFAKEEGREIDAVRHPGEWRWGGGAAVKIEINKKRGGGKGEENKEQKKSNKLSWKGLVGKDHHASRITKGFENDGVKKNGRCQEGNLTL